LDITDQIKRKKQKDKKQYKRSIKEMQNIIEGRSNPVFLNDMAGSVETELELIFRYYHLPSVSVPENVLPEQRFDYILNTANVMNREIQLKSKWWHNDAMPLLCIEKKSGSYRAVIPGKCGGLYYYDFILEKKIRVTKKNAKQFEQDAFCFYQPLPEESLTAWKLMCYLMKSISFADYLFLIVASLIVALLGLILPLVNNYIFQFVIPSGQKSDIPYVFILLFGVVLSSAMFGLFRSIWIARMGDKIKNIAESGLWNRILNLPPQFFKQYDSGELTSRAMMLEQICDMIINSMIPVLLTMAFSFVYLIQISAFSKELLLPVLLILFCLLAFSCLHSFFIIGMNRRQNKITVLLSGFVYQLFQAIGILKVNNAEIRAFSKWSELYGEKMRILPNFVVKFADSIHILITMGGSILIYNVVFQHGLSASVYISFQVAFGFLTGTLVRFSGIVTQIAYIKPAIQMLKPILKEKPEKNRNKARVTKLGGKIDINNLCFRYSEDMDLVINNLTLSIQPGEYVALVGASGCGKSTLFRLLLGFEKADRGAVYYDGRDLNELDQQSVRRRIGTVLQDGMLFAGDIYSNIALCTPDLTMDEAWLAARQAGCEEDIKNMPMGMFTMVSDGGGGISGGQKQRILIARTLAMNPDIMFFDEATSALDNITQKCVVESLSQRKITRIVIAHRLSTIQNCDRIIYLDKGCVAEEGTYQELMEKQGKFYELAKWQLM